jgi:hypothetical protein
MKAKPGDRIIIAPPRIETPVREGEILETRGPDGTPPFLVLWTDGHEGLLFPGPGSILQLGAAGAAQESEPATPPPTAEPPRAHVHDWQVRISIFGSGDDTDVQAVLLSDTPEHLTAQGHSHRSARDQGVPEIGDEVAVARALRALADRLLDNAADDIERVTGEHDVILRSR